MQKPSEKSEGFFNEQIQRKRKEEKVPNSPSFKSRFAEKGIAKVVITRDKNNKNIQKKNNS